jgi:hypothetical protein
MHLPSGPLTACSQWQQALYACAGEWKTSALGSLPACLHCCGCGCLCVCVCVRAVRRRCDVWRVRSISVATLAVRCVGDRAAHALSTLEVRLQDVAAMGSWQPALHVLGASECMTHILDSLDQLIHVSDRGSELVPVMPCHGDGNLCLLGASE